MRAYYPLETPIVAGWRLLDPGAPLNIKRDVDVGETDVVTFWPGSTLPNPRRWRQPPHEALANLGYPSRERTATELCTFIKQYGTLVADSSGLADSGFFEISVTTFRNLQERLQDAWRRADAKQLWLMRGLKELDNFDLPVTWVRGLALCPADCWTYIRLLLTRDLGAGRAKVCANPQCSLTPFFIAKRNDAMFCSHKCALDVNNRRERFRKRRRHAK